MCDDTRCAISHCQSCYTRCAEITAGDGAARRPAETTFSDAERLEWAWPSRVSLGYGSNFLDFTDDVYKSFCNIKHYNIDVIIHTAYVDLWQWAGGRVFTFCNWYISFALFCTSSYACCIGRIVHLGCRPTVLCRN